MARSSMTRRYTHASSNEDDFLNESCSEHCDTRSKWKSSLPGANYKWKLDYLLYLHILMFVATWVSNSYTSKAPPFALKWIFDSTESSHYLTWFLTGWFFWYVPMFCTYLKTICKFSLSKKYLTRNQFEYW